MNKKQTRPQQQTEKDARAGLHKNHRQRLRDRYEKTRLDGFADHEALELLLTFAIPRGDVNPTAHRLLERFGSLERVLQASPKELAQVFGIGEKSALLLSVCGELYARIGVQRATKTQAPVLDNAQQAARFALELCRGERYECVYLVSLDKNRRVLHQTRLFQGTLTETPLYPRQVVEAALQNRAHSVLLGVRYGIPSCAIRSSRKFAAASVDK